MKPAWLCAESSNTNTGRRHAMGSTGQCPDGPRAGVVAAPVQPRWVDPFDAAPGLVFLGLLAYVALVAVGASSLRKRKLRHPVERLPGRQRALPPPPHPDAQLDRTPTPARRPR